MKCYYPTDKSGNRIGFKTPEACIYDTSGTNLTNKLKQLRTDVNGKAAASHGNHVPATQTANSKVYLRNDNTWHTITPSDIGAAASSHSHSWDSITGKPSTYTPSSHTHTIAQVTNLQSSLDGKAAKSHSHSWDSITSKPSLYTSSQIDSKVDAINSNITSINGKLNLPKLVNVGSVQGLQVYNCTTTTEQVYTCKDLGAGTVILAYFSFAGGGQLFDTKIIDTPSFLGTNGQEVRLRDNENNQVGTIVRKSSTSISLRTTDSRWQVRVVIY